MSNTFGFVAAADTTNIQAGGTSFFEDAGNMLTKGVGAAVVSGLQSIYNTGIDLSNKVFDSKLARADTAETLSSLDSGWGDYYKKNKEAIDTAGFFATSIIPGTLAVKGLKAIQTGNSFGAFGRVLGYTNRAETAYLNTALTELAAEGGSVFSRISQAKTLSMAWGTADAVLQTAAFETATAVTMKASPMLDDKEWKDIGWDITKTSLTGGVLGGGINALMTNRLVKDAGALVAGKQRMYDVLEKTGDINVGFGDKAYGIIDALTKLPAEVTDSVVKLNHGRKDLVQSLDLTKLLDSTRRTTAVRGIEQLQLALTTVVREDVSVGTALSKSLIDVVKQGIDTGANPYNMKKTLGDLLFNLHSVEALGARPLDVSGELRFLSPRADFTTRTVMTSEKQAGDWAYRVIGDELQARMGTLGKDAATKQEAYALGFDAVIDPANKNVHINPMSNVWKQVPASEQDFAPIFYDTATHSTAATAVPTISDIATGPAGKIGGLSVNFQGVQSGSKTFAFSTSGKFVPTEDTVELTARHLWADGLQQIGGKIDSRDISLLDALLKNPTKAASDLHIADEAAGTSVAFADIGDFSSYVFTRKYAALVDELHAGPTDDLRKLAAKYNVEGKWIEDGTASSLDAKKMFDAGGWNPDAARYADRQTLVFRYDTQGMKDAEAHATGIVAYSQRVKEATSRAKDAALSVLGREHQDRLIEVSGSLAGESNGQAVGPTLFGASNAGYADRLRAWAQYTGQQVGIISTERVSAALSKIQSPAARLLQNPDAAAEVAAAVTKFRLSAEPQALYQDYLSGKYMMVDLESFKNFKEKGGRPEFKTRIPLSEDAGNFIAAHQELHQLRGDQQKVLQTASGMESRWDQHKLYFPPVDTQRLPFFAYVRQTEGSLFASSEVAMINARSAAELQQLAAQVEKTGNFTVIYKADTEAYHKAHGDFQFGRVMNDPVINDALRSRNILGAFLPGMTPENVVNDFVQYTQRAETKLARDAVSMHYGQTIAELQDLSNRYTAGQTSKFEGLSKLLQRNVQDPFGDAIKTAMNVSKRGEFTLWHQANEFVDAIGAGMGRGLEKALLDARGGQITWEDANKQLEKFGLGAHFTDAEAFKVAQTAPDRNLIKTAMQKANMLLANGMLRLDFANSLLNVISTPILLGTEVQAIRNSIKMDEKVFAQFSDMLSVGIPGTELKMPTTRKLLFTAMQNYFGDKSPELLARYKAIGAVKGPAALFHDMVDDLSLLPGMVPSEYAKKVDKWVEVGATITGSNRAEDMTRFVTANVMHQITEPLVAKGLMKEAEQNAFINIFVNRVQGNYVASQRPILFQGTLGSAVGLFQTYQFNLFQQLFRHIENRDAKTVAVMGALQGTMFGLNGLPLFDAINTQIVGGASINAGHKDAYSYAVEAAGKPIGDWLMYGTASAMPLFSNQAPALWTRGDLNPRSTFIIPTNPTDVPAVSATLKVAQTLLGMGKQFANGASATDALLFGLEHNGINRPLTGLAQAFKGSVTTSKGDLISAAADWNSISTASRLIGAKPLDESIAMSTLYRSQAYKAMDKQRIDNLGLVIKEKLANGGSLSSDDWMDFQGKYAAAGGRIQGFSQAVQRWNKAGNTSVINDLMHHNQTPAGQRMIEVMGGDQLPDFTNPAPAIGEGT